MKRSICLTSNFISLINLKLITSFQDPNFPDDRVIEEFKKQIDAKNLRLTERKPSLRDAVDIVVDELQWSEHYAVETILPIFTYWILTDNECVNGEPEVTPIRYTLHIITAVTK